MNFKKLIPFILVFLVVTKISSAQKNSSAKDSLKTAAHLKSGNSQDVLISFFQLAFNDLTGDNKTFKFQSSLFAIKAKTDDDLWLDRNYLKEKFSRNFVFSIAPSLDSSFKFKSNSIGFKYAIVNNRDKTIFDFSKPTDMHFLSVKRQAIEEYAKDFEKPNESGDYKKAVSFFLDEDEERTDLKDLPPRFLEILGKVKKGTIFDKFTAEQFRDYLNDQYKSLAQYVENRALWTVESSFASTNNGNLFSGVNVSSVFLKGLIPENKKTNIELNLKASMDFSDDTISLNVNDLNRQVFNFSGGLNWIILRNSKSKSIIEFKAAVAYNYIFKGVYLNENKSKFTGDGTLRFRITDQIWIPVNIMYDPGNGNVFGFISVRSNFDWLK